MNLVSDMNKLSQYVALTAKETKAKTRITTLFDADTFVELDSFTGASEEGSGVICGYGYIGEDLVYAYSQDVDANGGAVTEIQAKKIKRVYELAAKTGCPIISIFDSNGAKLTQATKMLEAYGEILMWSNNLSGVVPQIALVLGTCAGTSSLLACSADYLIMSKDAELFMTAPFVTNAMGQSKEAGTAEFVAKYGVASMVCDDEACAIEQTRKIISFLPSNNIAPMPLFESNENVAGVAELATIANDVLNMDAKATIKAIADVDSVVELFETFGTGIVTSFALVNGMTVGFVANNETAGAFDKDACDKASRFVRACDAFNVPVVNLVNTAGFEKTACPRMIRESAKLAHSFAEATTAKINVICGQAIGSAYIALVSRNANSDVSVAWPCAAVSAMGLEATVEFLNHDKLKGTEDLQTGRDALVGEYLNEVAGAFKIAEQGFVDAVINPADTRKTITNALEMLAGKRESRLPKKHSNMPL